jgi:hypothetical protein
MPAHSHRIRDVLAPCCCSTPIYEEQLKWRDLTRGTQGLYHRQGCPWTGPVGRLPQVVLVRPQGDAGPVREARRAVDEMCVCGHQELRHASAEAAERTGLTRRCMALCFCRRFRPLPIASLYELIPYFLRLVRTSAWRHHDQGVLWAAGWAHSLREQARAARRKEGVQHARA